MSKAYDVVVVGAGQGGLVLGSYLAKLELKKLVLERRDVIGAAALIHEIAREYRASIVSYFTSILRPRIMADIDLRRRRSLRIMSWSFGSAPRDDCDHIVFLGPVAKMAKHSGRTNKEDGEIYIPREWPNCCMIEDGGLLRRRRCKVGTPGRYMRRIFLCDGSSGGPGLGSTRAAWAKVQQIRHD